MTPTTPIFEITQLEHGWADVVIRDGERGYECEGVSHALNDGLGEFARAVQQVVTGALSGAESRWYHEPALTSVLVRRCETYKIELRFGYNDGNQSGHASPTDSVPEFTTEFVMVVEEQA
jgi:hypothetical protein